MDFRNKHGRDLTLDKWMYYHWHKENAQFLFSCNPQKSGASRAYNTFPRVTKKILTTAAFHWLELITVSLSFLNIISLKERLSLFFSIFQKTCMKIKAQRLYFGRIARLLYESFKLSFIQLKVNDPFHDFLGASTV